jgi:putative DNA primase/helicase
VVERYKGKNNPEKEFADGLKGTTDKEAANAPGNTNEYLDKLAKFGVLEYEQKRKLAAKKLNIRPVVLDKLVAERRELNKLTEASAFMVPVEPWSTPVNGDDLLHDLCDVIERHLILPKWGTEALALWVFHCHAHDAARHSPILFATSPTKQCGKTNLLATLSMVVPKPLSAANVTPATVFRAIARWHPTLLIDESDTFLSDQSDLRGVLNSGHTRSQAFVLRCVGDDLVPTQFSTWSPKAFAAIGRLHPTLEDRSIKIELRRKLRSEQVERIPSRDDAYGDLRRKIARWVADHIEELKHAHPSIPKELTDRGRDNWEPLLAIANAAGGDWATLARTAARHLSRADDDETYAIVLLKNLAAMFETEGDELSSTTIVATLNEMEDRPWSEFKKQQANHHAGGGAFT